MVMKKLLLITLAAALCAGCSSKHDEIPVEVIAPLDTLLLPQSNPGVPCRVEFGDVVFTRSLNNAHLLLSRDNDGKRLRFNAGGPADFFCDPSGKSPVRTAPLLLTPVDNTKPFTLTAKVKPHFTRDGLYNAAALYIYANPHLWQKLAYEQDEQRQHRIVSVRTRGRSDDCNHDVVRQQYVYLRIHSDTKSVALYYSLDKREWDLVRLHQNEYPAKVYVGISNQCPADTASYSHFEELALGAEPIADLRLGK